jgi:outer membrane receptor for ferrienterochelin and colicin
VNATYFNNLFHDQIEYGTNQADLGQFFNVQKSIAHGAEVELQGRIWKRLSLNTAYTYHLDSVSASAALHPGEFLRSCI